MVALVGRFGVTTDSPHQTQGLSIKFTPPDHLPLRACLYHPLYCLNLLRGSQRDRCIRETHNDGSLKFSSILIVDKVAVSDVEGTSLV